MDIRIKVKPIFWGYSDAYKTKDVLYSAILSASCRKVVSDNLQMGINYEKRGPVYKQTKFKNGKTKKTELVRKAHWVAWVYYFEKHFPVKVVQHARHFSLTQKP